MGKGVEEVHRIDALNLNPLFIEALAVAVQETLSLQERCEREVL
jgi:protoheme ferro-lyase